MSESMFRRKITTLLLILFSVFLCPLLSYAQGGEGDPNQQILAKLRLIEERVKKIEADQQENLDRQQKILTELDRLRIWVHRR